MKKRYVFILSFVFIGLFIIACNSETPLAPDVTGISPTNSCNLDPVSITDLSGANFKSGITVTLIKSGESDIQATNVVVVSSESLSCDFDITGASLGTWSIQISDSAGSAQLTNAFEITNALYVSTTGEDTNAGTASSPKLTIQNAIDNADPGQHIRVSAGTYNIADDIVLAENVSLYGGYDPVSWVRDTTTYTTTLQDTRSTDTLNADTPHAVIYAGSTITTATVIDGFNLQGSTTGADYTSAIHCHNFATTGPTHWGPTVQNNKIDGGTATSYSYGIFLRGYLRTVIDQNTINGGDGVNSYGIYGRLLFEVKIKNNTIYGGSGTNSYGMYFRQASNPYIQNNVIDGGGGTTTYGIYCYNNPSSTIVIRNNTIDGGGGSSSSYGIVSGSSVPNIDNNIIFCTGSSSEYGIFEYDATLPSSVDNNDIFDCASSLYREYNGGTAISHTTDTTINALAYADSNISVDPVLDDASNGNYHLTDTTPASVTGGGLNGIDESWINFPENNLGFPIDKDQEMRPESGTSWAIGAYE